MGGGGGGLELGNPEGRGAQAVLEIHVEAGVKKPCLPSWGCGFFTGITQYSKHFLFKITMKT